MANTRSKASKSTSTTNAVTKEEVVVNEPSVVAEESNSAVVEEKQYRVKKNLDPNMIVTVKNGYQGLLVYRSRRTDEKFEWSTFGDEQDMSLQELKYARNASKAFFENNWFLIDDPEVLEYLGVTRFYKYALNADSFDELFKQTPDEIKERLSHLSDGQKKTVAYRAKTLIAEKKIDSLSVITALEEGLSVELIDR